MRLSGYHIVLAIVLAIAAGCLGAVAAGYWDEDVAPRGLHDFAHEELDLDADQMARLDALEADFAIERARLEQELRSANADLAKAIEEEHAYGPKVSAAIEAVHVHMGELQKATVRHVFAMRELLNDRQRQIFDRQVSESLTGAPRD